MSGICHYWPPKGWDQFRQITETIGQAVSRDIKTARLVGLSYTVQSSVMRQRKELCHHKITINGWDYTIHNESHEYPVLSFDLQDRHDRRKPRRHFVRDIKVMACPLDGRGYVPQRVMMAALFFMKQIRGRACAGY